MELYGISEAHCLLEGRHFVGTRCSPLKIEGDIVEHVLDRHLALGVKNVIWDLGRSFMTFHTDNPLLTPMGAITKAEGRESELPKDGWIPPWHAYFSRTCPLRKALDGAAERSMPLWGWLCMNRCYGNGSGAYLASRFWRDNCERLGEYNKDGSRDLSRLSYFFEEYQEERKAAVLEAARITGPKSGKHIDCIVLDFVRQPPMLLYHPDMCHAYMDQGGPDPRGIKAVDVEPFMQWCRWRADILTDFVQEVRREMPAGVRLGMRITDLGLNINLIEGVDVETLLIRKLIDVIVTSPLDWVRGVSNHSVRPYVAAAKGRGVPVIAGVSLNQQTRFHTTPGSANFAVLTQRVRDYQEQGADGIAFYQSESGLEFDGIEEVVPAFADPQATERLLKNPDFLRRWPVTHLNCAYGLDCHSWFNDYTIDGAQMAI